MKIHKGNNLIGLFTVVLMLLCEVHCQLYYNCDFSNCDLAQIESPGDDFDWTRRRGKTASTGTGPFGDHTTLPGSGYYSYIEVSSPVQPGDIAIALTPNFTLPAGECALATFWYYAHGTTFGSFNVSMNSSVGLRTKTHLWSFDEKRWLRWRMAAVKILNSGSTVKNFTLIFEASKGSSYRGDIAIDDIMIQKTDCNNPLPHTESRSNFTCDFQHNVCGMSLPDQWRRGRNGGNFFETGPSKDNTLESTSGYYAFHDDMAVVYGLNSTMSTHTFNFTTGCGLLTFFYYAKGLYGLGDLRIILDPPFSNSEILWEVRNGVNDFYSPVSAEHWRHIVLPIRFNGSFSIGFQVEAVSGMRGDYAIDDVIITEEECSRVDALDSDLFTPDKPPTVVTGLWGKITGRDYMAYYHKNDLPTWIINASPKQYIRMVISSFTSFGAKLMIDGVEYGDFLYDEVVFVEKDKVAVNLTMDDGQSEALVVIEIYWKATDYLNGNVTVLYDPDGVLEYTTVPNQSWEHWWILDTYTFYYYWFYYSGIQFHLQDGSLLEHTGCGSTSVKVYDGIVGNANDSTQLVQNYCGNDTHWTSQANITTTSKAMVLLQVDPTSTPLTVSVRYTPDYYGSFSTLFPTIPTVTTTSGPGVFDSVMYDRWGIIESPLFPSTYPNNARYSWTFVSNYHEEVAFNVTFVDLEHGYDFLWIGSSLITTERFVLKTLQPGQPITINFTSDDILTQHGFQIYYMRTNASGANILELQNIFSSGEFDTRSLSSTAGLQSEDMWLFLKLPAATSIEVTFQSFQIEQQCAYNNSLKIYEGIAKSYKLINTFCGSSLPPAVNISGPNMMVFFRSNPGVIGNHVKFLWIAKGLDGIHGNSSYSSDFGVLHSPGWPGTYHSFLQQKYKIETGSQYVLLYFTTYSLESCCDHLYINSRDTSYYYDSSYVNGSASRIPGGQVLFEFETDSSIEYQGFELFFKATNLSSGTLNYLASKCESLHVYASQPSDKMWLIDTGYGGVRIRFERITLPACDENNFIRIYQGFPNSTTSGRSLQYSTHCSMHSQNYITVSGTSGKFMIWFKANPSSWNSQSGFSLYWERQDVTCANRRGNTSFLNQEFGVLSTPANTLFGKQTWFLSVFPSKYMFFKFKHNSLSSNEVLRIDGVNYGSRFYSGIWIGKDFVNVTYLLTARIKRDVQPSNDPSFQLFFKGTNSTDGAIEIFFINATTATSYYIESPNYPFSYTPNSDYLYIMYSAVGTQIKFTIEDMHIYNSSGCVDDYMLLIDGSIYNGHYIKDIKYCGTGSRDPWKTSANHAILQFHSGNSHGFIYTGIKLKYVLTTSTSWTTPTHFTPASHFTPDSYTTSSTWNWNTPTTTTASSSKDPNLGFNKGNKNNNDDSGSNIAAWIVPTVVVVVGLAAGLGAGIFIGKKCKGTKHPAETGAHGNSDDRGIENAYVNPNAANQPNLVVAQSPPTAEHFSNSEEKSGMPPSYVPANVVSNPSYQTVAYQAPRWNPQGQVPPLPPLNETAPVSNNQGQPMSGHFPQGGGRLPPLQRNNGVLPPVGGGHPRPLLGSLHMNRTFGLTPIAADPPVRQPVQYEFLNSPHADPPPVYEALATAPTTPNSQVMVGQENYTPNTPNFGGNVDPDCTFPGPPSAEAMYDNLVSHEELPPKE